MPSLITTPLITEALGLLARVDAVRDVLEALIGFGASGLMDRKYGMMTLARELTEYSCRASLGEAEPAAEALARTVAEARDILQGYGPRGEVWMIRYGDTVGHAYGVDGLPVCGCRVEVCCQLWPPGGVFVDARECRRCQAALGAARSRGAGAAVAEGPTDPRPCSAAAEIPAGWKHGSGYPIMPRAGGR